MYKLKRSMSERMKKASKEASEKSFREQLKDIGTRGVSEHEAVARIISVPMRKSNLQVKFIPTDYKENRTRMSKPFSGKAASNIEGIILYTAFALPVKDKSQLSKLKTPAERLNSHRAFYQNLKIMIVDEISMLGSIQEIYKRPSVPFAGISILAVLDLSQLNPVGDEPV
ncbi:hypothetical protein KUTeg_012407 [Tegillarca granosa]|uniref:DNA helicase n=1 Tax=Tegillarca granosa TaxID=220873 RepID=A0ABQ9F3S3_TEGGR|nr:hypothetical protein KUTeg_012407 [Tegillarca granosa]